MLSMNNSIKRPEFKEKFVELSQDVFKVYIQKNKIKSVEFFFKKPF